MLQLQPHSWGTKNLKRLRAVINGVSTSTIRCEVSRHEIVEEDQEWFRGNEVLCSSWTGSETVKASFKLRDKKLYDFALGLLHDQVTLSIENAEIIDIQKVRVISTECPSCCQIVWPERINRWMTNPSMIPKYRFPNWSGDLIINVQQTWSGTIAQMNALEKKLRASKPELDFSISNLYHATIDLELTYAMKFW